MGPTLDPNRIPSEAEGCEGSPDRAAANSTDSAVEPPAPSPRSIRSWLRHARDSTIPTARNPVHTIDAGPTTSFLVRQVSSPSWRSVVLRSRMIAHCS